MSCPKERATVLKFNKNLTFRIMKTLNDLLELIMKAVLLETCNNFLIKNNVHFSSHSGLISFSIDYVHGDLRTSKVDILFNTESVTETEIQMYYWQIANFIQRHNK